MLELDKDDFMFSGAINIHNGIITGRKQQHGKYYASPVARDEKHSYRQNYGHSGTML
jgi:hypothetical protein